MTFATVRSSSQQFIASATTEYLFTLPTPIEAGDRILVAVSMDGSNNNQNLIFNGNGNWGQIAVARHGTVLIEAWHESAQGDEDATVLTVSAATTETAAFKCWVFANNGSAPEAVTSIIAGADNSVAFGALTPSGGAQDYVWIGVVGANDESVSTFSSGYANTGSQPGTEVTPRLHWQRRNLNTDTEQADDLILSASDQWASMMIAVFPGSAVAEETTGLLMRRRHAQVLRAR